MKVSTILVVVLGVVCIGIWLSVNTGEPRGDLQRSIENHGLTDVHVGGWDPLSCAGEDTISRSFTAKRSDGKVVSGTVCCGLVLKNCTIRW